MKIKITNKILSITPYLSTSWPHVAALHMKGGVLAVTLTDGDTVNVPGLSNEAVELIFTHHTTYLEQEHVTAGPVGTSLQKEESGLKGLMDQMSEPSVRLAFGSLDGLSTAMQHNPAQSDAPDLPAEIIQKIGAISKIIAPPDEIVLPKAEPFCNCFHCQIARVLNPASEPIEEKLDHEEVSDEELQFQEWTITQTGDQLFSVAHRLDTNEKYSVYLGEPVGCTCGKQGCEHILAVLKS